MEYIVLDLEWNGAYSKKAHGYFNEIIEIGATRMNEQGKVLDGFHTLIRPVASRKLTHFVTDLTGIEAQTLENGTTFAEAMDEFEAWIGQPEALALTWSTTDLLVLLENYRFFLNIEYIPFMTHYMDAQAYFQSRMQLTDAGHQIGLAKAGELCELSLDDMDMHRAEDDSRLTARVLEHVWDAASFAAAIRKADAEFYKRLTFKARAVSTVTDPLMRREYLEFVCPTCGKALHKKGNWRFFGQALCTDMGCSQCKVMYTARVQVKERYEGVTVKRKLNEKKPPETAEKKEKGEKTE